MPDPLYRKARDEVDAMMRAGRTISEPDSYARAIARRQRDELARNNGEAADNAPAQAAINRCQECDHIGLRHYWHDGNRWIKTTRNDARSTAAERCQHGGLEERVTTDVY